MRCSKTAHSITSAAARGSLRFSGSVRFENRKVCLRCVQQPFPRYRGQHDTHQEWIAILVGVGGGGDALERPAPSARSALGLQRGDGVWYLVLYSPWRAAFRRIPSAADAVKRAVASNPQAAGPNMRDSSLSRRDMLKASTVLAAGAAFAEPLAAAAPEPTPPSAAMIQGARKEGTLAFYTAMELPLAEGLSKAFEAKYPGIKVRVKRSGAERVFQRIGKEEEIRIHEVDVVCSTDAGHFVRWRREGLLAPFLPEDAAKHLPPEQIGAEGMYATAFASLSPIGYNTNLVKPEEAPTTFADLLDPRWRGKLVKGTPDYSGPIFTATFALARDLGWSYFERLAQQKVVQVQSSRDPPNRLARGESAVQADGARSELLLLRERGAPVEVVYAGEGTPLIIAPSA